MYLFSILWEAEHTKTGLEKKECMIASQTVQWGDIRVCSITRPFVVFLLLLRLDIFFAQFIVATSLASDGRTQCGGITFEEVFKFYRIKSIAIYSSPPQVCYFQLHYIRSYSRSSRSSGGKIFKSKVSQELNRKDPQDPQKETFARGKFQMSLKRKDPQEETFSREKFLKSLKRKDPQDPQDP